MLGELAVLGGVTRAASARALKPTAIVEWGGDAFRRLVMADTTLSERVIRDLLRTLVEEELALVACLAGVRETAAS